MRILFAIPLLLLLPAVIGCEDEPETPAPEATPAAGETGSSAAPAEDPLARFDPHAGQNVDRPTPSHTGGSPAGGIAWEIPAPFQSQPPASSMRAAEYLFPEEEGERAATMTVFFFGTGQGGSVQANITRWVGQFTLPEGTEPNISQREVNGLDVTVVDVTGTFSGGDMGTPTGAHSGNQRMLAAIVEGPEGPVFFKMTGGTSLMARAEAPFTELVESFRPE